MNTNRSTICVHEHAAERNANVCLNCKGQWERKIMNKENKLVIRILKRILLLAVVMFLLSVVVFWLARLAPGDPLQSFYGDSLEMMTSEEVAAARTRLGLDQGIGVQYVRWFTNVVRGDLGLSNSSLLCAGFLAWCGTDPDLQCKSWMVPKQRCL